MVQYIPNVELHFIVQYIPNVMQHFNVVYILNVVLHSASLELHYILFYRLTLSNGEQIPPYNPSHS